MSTAAACKAAAACRLDTAGGDPLAAYDALIAKLDAGPIMVRFPTAAGTFVDRPLAKTDVETTAVSYGYGPFGRSQFLRALTAASKGDYVPMLRAYYDSIVVDPETLKTIPDPTYSDAMYYSTECQDYAFYLGAGDADARAKAWLDEGAKTGINDLRLGGTYYGDMPCVYWPAQPKTDPRPDGDREPALPDVHHDRDERPGDPDRQRDAAVRPTAGRVLHRGARRRSCDLRSRRRLPGQDDHRLPRVRHAARDPGHHLRQRLRRRVRRQRPAEGHRLPRPRSR